MSKPELLRHTIVLGPKEESLLRDLSKELHLSRSAAIRYALSQLEHRQCFEAIRQGYRDFPETSKEHKEAESMAKSAAKSISREQW